jgi:addiction module HigA family antidote
MTMHNPPHPGAFIRQIYLEPHQMSVRALAGSLGVAPSTVTRIINDHSAISPEMALRLAKALGRSAESWLAMQHYPQKMLHLGFERAQSYQLGLEFSGMVAPLASRWCQIHQSVFLKIGGHLIPHSMPVRTGGTAGRLL